MLVAQRGVDASAIAVVGSSYGGYLAALLTALRPVQVARPARAGAVQGLGLDVAEGPAASTAGTRRVPAAARAVGGEPGAGRVRELPRATRSSSSRNTTHSSRGQVIANYREALVGAASLTYRMLEGADHGLSDATAQQAYTGILVNWLREMIQGARADARAAKSASQEPQGPAETA